jgi:2'-5' RNA ligase
LETVVLVLRAIHIFPDFKNVAVIERLRAKYDPLFNLIQPHITLVFPFDSDLSTNALEKHLHDAIRGHSPFRVVLKGITGYPGGYLFLNVKVGNDEIIALHDKLYSGPLQPYLDRTVTYTPHLTIGRIADDRVFQDALVETEGFSETFESFVAEIVTEVIDSTGKSHIELRTPLK